MKLLKQQIYQQLRDELWEQCSNKIGIGIWIRGRTQTSVNSDIRNQVWGQIDKSEPL